MNHNNQIPSLNNISGDLSSTLPFSIIIDNKEVMKFEKEQVITSVDKILKDNVELPPITRFGHEISYAQLITGLQGVRILNNLNQETLARFSRTEGNEIKGELTIGSTLKLDSDSSALIEADNTDGNRVLNIKTFGTTNLMCNDFNNSYKDWKFNNKNLSGIKDIETSGDITIDRTGNSFVNFNYDSVNMASFGYSSTAEGVYIKSNNKPFLIESAPTVGLRLQTDGKLGIGMLPTEKLEVDGNMKCDNITLKTANPVISDSTNTITFSSLHGIECNQIHLTKVKHKKNVLTTTTIHDSNILMVNESSGNKTITFDTPDRLFYLLNHSASDIDLTFTYNGTETITSSEIHLNSTLLFDSVSNSITYPTFKGRDFKAVYIGITSNTVIYYLT